MKIHIFIAFFTIILSGYGHSQDKKLQFYHSRKIMNGEQKLTRLEVHQIMKEDIQALEQFKQGKTLRTLGDISFFGGLGLVIGGTIYYFYGEGKGVYFNNSRVVAYREDPSIAPILIGGGMLLLTIPLKVIGKNKIEKSVNTYNNNLESATSSISKNDKLDYQVVFISNNKGLGIRLIF